MTYTQSMKRLEEIVAQIENGQTDIDTLTLQLKEAKQLIAQCRQRLTTITDEAKNILDDNSEM